jgi:lauroyl/myristoyl acyltransferase
LEHSVRLSLKALKRKEIVAIIGDANYGNPQAGICVDFFKHRAYFPEGPAVFSLKTGTPVFFGFLIRKPENHAKYKFILDGPLYPVSTGNIEADVRRLIQQIALKMEGAISQYPQQWFMINNIWCT